MRAVLDVNVIISALLSPSGSPAKVLRAWLDGTYELVASPQLLAELERALSYPKLRKHITAPEAAGVVDLLRKGALMLEDPARPPTIRSTDSGDDYVIALAESARVAVVSGDDHLLRLAKDLPVYSPRAFLELVAERG